jgi:hypothetical protein
MASRQLRVCAQLPYITSTIAVVPDAFPEMRSSVPCGNRTDAFSYGWQALLNGSQLRPGASIDGP